ncbi:MAG: glycosyltransferase [Nanoarchaeota archaeon]
MKKQGPEISVVIPCLNEETTIEAVVLKAIKAFKDHKILGEVVVSDNGSKDHSREIAKKAGARVVIQEKKGYGNALQKGFIEARGKFLLMGDADNTYDMLELPKFVKLLRQGNEFVIGTRLKGKILKGAMPWLHRYVGNPFLTTYLNMVHGTKISDSHCGMRAFTKSAYKKMKPLSPGMEFASELIIRAAEEKLLIKEIPITYYPRKGESKLHSFKDGWRHLRFMLLYSPFYVFFFPGIILFIFGMMLLLLLLQGPANIFGLSLDIHPMFLGSLCVLLGYQIIVLGMYSRALRVPESLEGADKLTKYFFKNVTLERGILAGFVLLSFGFVINLLILIAWINNGFKDIAGIRYALMGMTLFVIGAQTMFSSFFMSVLRLVPK